MDGFDYDHDIAERATAALALVTAERDAARKELDTANYRIAALTEQVTKLMEQTEQDLSEAANVAQHRDYAVSVATELHRTKEVLVSNRNAVVTERDAAIAARNVAIGERSAAIAERDAAIAEREALFPLAYWGTCVDCPPTLAGGPPKCKNRDRYDHRLEWRKTALELQEYRDLLREARGVLHDATATAAERDALRKEVATITGERDDLRRALRISNGGFDAVAALLQKRAEKERALVLDACADVCRNYAEEHGGVFGERRGSSPGEGYGEGYEDGRADGATDCAARIDALKESFAKKGTES